jgi:5-methylcytosine-specific restriction endonuclease McrA
LSRKPVECAGGCGGLVQLGRGSLPAGQATCRGCRRGRRMDLCVVCGVTFTQSRPPGSRSKALSLTCSVRCGRITKGRAAIANLVRARAARGQESLDPVVSAARRRERNRAYRRAHPDMGRARRRRYKARKRGVRHEPYTLAEIAARDRYTCGICRRRVAMTKVVPHPKAPTVDHLVPVSAGGDDVRANVRLAHFLCNSRRGVGGVVQLALI